MLFETFWSLCSNLNFIVLSSDLLVFTVKKEWTVRSIFHFFCTKVNIEFFQSEGVWVFFCKLLCMLQVYNAWCKSVCDIKTRNSPTSPSNITQKRCNTFRTCAKMHFTEKNILGLCALQFLRTSCYMFFFLKDVVTSCSELVPEFLQSDPSVLRGIKSVVCAEGGTSLEENLYRERLATCTFCLLMNSRHVYLYEDPEVYLH